MLNNCSPFFRARTIDFARVLGIMDQLPGDILGEIFGQIDDLIDVYHFAAVSRRFRATYLKIRASMLSLHISPPFLMFKTQHETMHIKVKNYRFHISILWTIADYKRENLKRKYLQYDLSNWRYNGNFTMDFSINIDEHNIINMCDSMGNHQWIIRRNKFGINEVLEGVQRQRIRSLYNTFLRDANVDEKFKETFLLAFV